MGTWSSLALLCVALCATTDANLSSVSGDTRAQKLRRILSFVDPRETCDLVIYENDKSLVEDLDRPYVSLESKASLTVSDRCAIEVGINLTVGTSLPVGLDVVLRYPNVVEPIEVYSIRSRSVFRQGSISSASLLCGINVYIIIP